MRSLVHKAYQQILATGKVRPFQELPPRLQGRRAEAGFSLRQGCGQDDTLHFADKGADTVGGLYNLGSGQASTWIELATAIFSALKREPQIEFIDMPESIRDKYQYFTQADMTKLRDSGYCETRAAPSRGRARLRARLPRAWEKTGGVSRGQRRRGNPANTELRTLNVAAGRGEYPFTYNVQHPPSPGGGHDGGQAQYSTSADFEI